MSNVECAVATWATRSPHQPAIVTPEYTWNYRQWHERIQALTTHLHHRGVRSGDRVALCLHAPADTLTLLMAIFRLGAVACPLNPAFPPAYREARLAQLDAALFVNHDTPCTTRTALVHGISDHEPPIHEAGPRDPKAPAAIIFTSGSTGKPKAAVLSFENLRYNARCSNENIPLTPHDTWLLSLPLHHVAGLGILFRCSEAGASIVIPQEGESLESTTQRCRTSHLSLVARQLARLMESAEGLTGLQQSKAILLGGGAIPHALITRAVAHKLPIHTSYGMTEMATQITTTRTGADETTLQSSGAPCAENVLRIGTDGVIQVNGPSRFLGYWSDGAIHAPVDEAGWFSTGDRGHLDAAGNLHITGRVDNMFVAGGENIQPETIEQALGAIPGVQQCLVVPVAHPEFGNSPVAFVDDTRRRSTGELQDLLRPLLPSYQIPRHIFPWPHLDASGGLKIPRSKFLAEARRLTEFP